MKKRIALIFSLVCFMTLFALSASAATELCDACEFSNVDVNRYGDGKEVVEGYLTKGENNGYMKVQCVYLCDGYVETAKVVAEYYDAGFNLKRIKAVDLVLPVFGGFYETEDNYYLLTGQLNVEEDESVECFNIAKYDKDWNLIKSVGLKACNTVVPFKASNASFASSGDYMVIRTSHSMYRLPGEGRHHQANMTIMIKMSTMEITDSYTEISNMRSGYCSHSFTQFVEIDSNNKVVAVDLGDAYPRSVALFLYPLDINCNRLLYDFGEIDESYNIINWREETVETDDEEEEVYDLRSYLEMYGDRCEYVSMLDIPGEIGDNYTGCSIGGLEISDTSYIVAGSCIDFSDYEEWSTKNVFISVVDKDDKHIDKNNLTDPKVTVTRLSNYKKGTESASSPNIIKINNNRFLVIWARGEKVYYQEINGKGKKVGKTRSFTGKMSSCEPKIINSKIMWYTYEYGVSKFYSININNTSSYKVTTVESGKHNYAQSKVIKEATFESKGKVQKTCTLCGDKKTEAVPVKTVGKPTKLKTKTTKTKSVSISWTKSANAKKYAIYLSTDGKKWKKVGSTKKTTYTVEKLSPGTTYRVKVKAFNGSYKSSYSSVLKIKTKSAAPTVALKAGSKKAAVSFNKVKGATAYEIVYSTDKSLKKKIKTVTVKSSGNVKKTIKKLKKGKKYYFKVRSSYVFKNKTVYSSYSKVKSVKIK